MPKTNIKLDVKEIYEELCLKCQTKLVSLIARKVAASSIEERLREQLESKASEKEK